MLWLVRHDSFLCLLFVHQVQDDKLLLTCVRSNLLAVGSSSACEWAPSTATACLKSCSLCNCLRGADPSYPLQINVFLEDPDLVQEGTLNFIIGRRGAPGGWGDKSIIKEKVRFKRFIPSWPQNHMFACNTNGLRASNVNRRLKHKVHAWVISQSKRATESCFICLLGSARFSPNPIIESCQSCSLHGPCNQ